MNLHTRLCALSLAALFAAAAQAQTPAQTTDANRAANSTGTSTSQQEMNRGVPGVDVDVGRNAQGAVDVDVDRNTNARNLPGVRDEQRNADGTMRAPRADRN